MPSAHLDLVRSVYADWARGDYSSAAWAHPEIEYVIAEGPDAGRWTGPVGLAEGYRHWLGAWKDLRIEAEGYRELDRERVLVLMRYSGRGKASGLDLGQVGTRGAHLFHVRDGRVTRLVIYHNRDRAFADLGLAAERDTE